MRIQLSYNDCHCTGCKACVQACKDFYNLPYGKNFRSVREVESINENGNLQVTYKSRCINPCKNHVCVSACPINLITIVKE
jgi:Fe-S-cluster-containing dehydrogenase component